MARSDGQTLFGFLVQNRLHSSFAGAASRTAIEFRFEVVHRNGSGVDSVHDLFASHCHTNTDKIFFTHALYIGYNYSKMKYILILPILLFLAIVISRIWGITWLLGWLRPRTVEEKAEYGEIAQILEITAKRVRMDAPELGFFSDFAPNGLTLSGFDKKNKILVSEGLVRLLSEKEWETYFFLCLGLLRQRARVGQSWLALFLFPVSKWVFKCPPWLQFLLAPALSAWIRLFTGRRAIFRADRFASDWVGPERVASLLQKINATSHKYPMEKWNFALDHLFMVSPTVNTEGPYWFFGSQPSVDARRKRLL